MGKLLSKFRGKKDTKDVLEKLHFDVKKLNEIKDNTKKTEKRLMLALMSVATLAWIGIIFYWYLTRPSEWNIIIPLVVALIMIPYCVFFLKKVLRWYYNRSVRKNEEKLKSLKEKKNEIIENLMETETFKVAKALLEKYDPDQLRGSTRIAQTPGAQKTSHSLSLSTLKPANTPSTKMPVSTERATELRQRNVKAFDWAGNDKGAVMPAPRTTSTPYQTHGVKFAANPPKTNIPFAARSPQNGVQAAPGPPLPKPILPRSRTYLDRVMDYLVGDGPNNRYALICHDCDSHNGMALAEEFEYTAFRCCYCFSWNPSRKERPKAPTLESSLADTTRTEISESEASSDEESDEEQPTAGRSATEAKGSSHTEDDNESEEDDNWKSAPSEKAEESNEDLLKKTLTFETSSELEKTAADSQASESKPEQ